MATSTKKASLIFSALFAAVISVSLIGCGGDDTTTQTKTEDLGNFLVPDYSTAEDFSKPADLAKVCVSSCTQDTDCQNSCAAPTSGVSCCDTQTSTCYTATTSVCPSASDAATSSPY